MSKRLEPLPQEMHIDLDSKLFNAVYYPYLEKVYPYEVYYGGSGSGKSTFIGQKLAVQMSLMPGRNLVCLRAQKTDCIESCWAEIYNSLRKFKLLRYWHIRENPDHRMINRVNGNEIVFEGVDNIEDIKSIKFTKKNDDTEGDSNLTDVWYEEVNAEPEKNTIEELDRRLRDKVLMCRIILSFNPVSRAHWLYEYVTRDLTLPGINALILKTTYKDNAFLPDWYSAKLERYKYTSPYNYQVYTLGNWGTLGQTIFNADKIQTRLNQLDGITFTRGDFIYGIDANKLPIESTYRFMEHRDGEVVIFQKPKPKYPYVISVDTAGEGSNYYAAQVCDNITGEQVARLHSNKSPSECVWQCHALACMYNHALACPEINFDSWIIKALQMLKYPKLYVRKQNVDKKHPKREDMYGWRTMPDNRPMMLSDMVFWTEEHMQMINDADTLNEMLTFTRQSTKIKGIWMGAEPGTNDDLVMAFAIMLQARSQQVCELIPERQKLEGFWTREELEDAVADGRIDRKSAQEYVRTNGCYLEDWDEKYRPLTGRKQNVR